MKHLIFGLVAGATFSMAFSHILHLSVETAQALIIFNFLFVCTLFPLNGSLKRKIIVLLMGNMVCIFWNYIFYLFASTVAEHIQGIFNALFVVLNPLLNLLWVISFWSISLTFLANSRNRRDKG